MTEKGNMKKNLPLACSAILVLICTPSVTYAKNFSFSSPYKKLISSKYPYHIPNDLDKLLSLVEAQEKLFSTPLSSPRPNASSIHSISDISTATSQYRFDSPSSKPPAPYPSGDKEDDSTPQVSPSPNGASASPTQESSENPSHHTSPTAPFNNLDTVGKENPPTPTQSTPQPQTTHTNPTPLSPDTQHTNNNPDNQPHDITHVGNELRIHVRNSLTSGPAESVIALGNNSDLILFGDWDGDGKDTFAVRKGTIMYLTNSPDTSSLDAVFPLGDTNDQVFVGDWDGDGKDTFALRRGNTMRVSNTLDFSSDISTFTYGRVSDDVYVGDWDGNGTDTLAVRRAPNIIHVKNSVTGGNADTSFTYGRVGDDLISGDWDGNGSDTFLVRRGNVMYPKSTLTGGYSDYSFTYGTRNDRTFAGDWDGDGKDSFAVVRNSHNEPKFRHPFGNISAIIGTWSSNVPYVVMAIQAHDPNYPSYTPRYDIILDGKVTESQRQAASTATHNTSFQATPGHHTVCIRVYGQDAGNSLTTDCAQVFVPIHPPQPDNQIPVFVYGSLRPGAEAHGDLHGRYSRVIPTSVVNEDLWITHTSTYGSDVWPWALPGSGTGNLRGEALTYGANYASELQRLDRYESARPDLPESRRNYNRVQKRTVDGWEVWLYEASSWRQSYVKRHGYKVPSGDIFRR